MDDYLGKPVQVDDLVEALKKCQPPARHKRGLAVQMPLRNVRKWPNRPVWKSQPADTCGPAPPTFAGPVKAGSAEVLDAGALSGCKQRWAGRLTECCRR